MVALIGVTVYGSVTSIQYFLVFCKLSFKFSSLLDDINADKRDLVVQRKTHRVS